MQLARRKQQAERGYLLGLLLDPDDEGSMLLRNVGEVLPNYQEYYLYNYRCENDKSNINSKIWFSHGSDAV
jgi:5S rRNA maturation endonuclease (ribonuclease M5)